MYNVFNIPNNLTNTNILYNFEATVTSNVYICAYESFSRSFHFIPHFAVKNQTNQLNPFVSIHYI